jgi:predicted nucleotidyltransferase
MKVLGIIAEYNPFHNGHLYHLEQSRKLTSSDYTVCVMSSNFIQRGEPAVVNKWARTQMALSCGIDLVLELPVVYSMSSAEFFAYGAVKILDSLGLVDNICFGTESGCLEQLDSIANILQKEPNTYRELLKENLSRGISFPAAREQALTGYFSQAGGFEGDIGCIMGSSNSILAIEYLKALKRLGSQIKPCTIARTSNAYNSKHLTGSISSATSIRKHIQSEYENMETLKEVIPEASYSILKKEFEAGRGPVYPSSFEGLVLSAIRKISKEELSALPYISEGLENRIKEAADNSGSFEELVENSSTRRYTITRIQRILFSILTGMTASEFDSFNACGGPQYIRVLGFSQRGRRLLSRMKETAALPVIVKTADYKNSCNPLLRRMLEIEASATDMYVLGYQNPVFRKSGQEFTQNIIRIGL